LSSQSPCRWPGSGPGLGSGADRELS